MKDLSIEELEVMLCSNGYLPPRDEDELDFFNQMYEGQKTRIEDIGVDIDSIVNGTCSIVSSRGYEMQDDEFSHSFVAEILDIKYSMAARNFDKLPKDIFERMKRQHKPKDGDGDL